VHSYVLDFELPLSRGPTAEGAPRDRLEELELGTSGTWGRRILLGVDPPRIGPVAKPGRLQGNATM